ncbi:hypothetical protein J4526_01780 [Desulfurococcaceae archaeon MEX13E-LK6-19]|nr:hypothetical protein J4526_01780 [Desulfurococcaceae archaeon MEX13E-LK6-19]
MSKEFDKGLLVGRSSLTTLLSALRKSLGEWARILPYLSSFSCRKELELVASINYVLGKEIELTPPLRASLAVDFVESKKDLLISDAELLLAGVGRGEEKEEKD